MLLLDLPSEIVCAFFQRAGRVLLGRGVSKKLHVLLLSCGSAEQPLYIRTLSEDMPSEDIVHMGAFIRTFRHYTVLVVLSTMSHTSLTRGFTDF